MISQEVMEQEEDQSGVKDSLMKTSNLNTNHSVCQWPTLEKTPTEVNSSSPPSPPHGWITDTLFSAVLNKVEMLSRLLKLLEQTQVDHQKLLLSENVRLFNCD